MNFYRSPDKYEEEYYIRHTDIIKWIIHKRFHYWELEYFNMHFSFFNPCCTITTKYIKRKKCCTATPLQNKKTFDRTPTVQIRKSFHMAPLVGLEPTTCGLTVRRSTDWAKEEYLCWRYLFSRPVTRQLSSAQMSLTSVFGMGTGGPSSQSTPTRMDELSLIFYFAALRGFLLFAALQPLDCIKSFPICQPIFRFLLPNQSPASRVWFGDDDPWHR